MSDATISITHDDLINLIAESDKRGTTMVSISTLTTVDARKKSADGTPNPYDVIAKVSHINAVLGGAYANAMAKETGGTYVPKPRKWGEHVTPSLIRHFVDGIERFYVTLRVNRVLTSPLYVASVGQFKKVYLPKSELILYLPADRAPTSAVIVRDYALASVRALKMHEKRYAILQRDEQG